MIPENLLYTKSHEWVKIDQETAIIGITHFAQEQLGDITFIELPEVGRTLEQGEEIGSIESVKAASEVYSPVSGEVIEINTSLEDAPEKINEDPYGEGWICKIKLSAPPQKLLTPEEYAKLIQEHE
ncbi:MAG: glycine cleavage system protein GcvH [Desulfonauticus sp.]|nr:glycine cleavage system protein GcvH [Desulfonauticus sp.]